ncbi:PP2C family protein-serine/threonine phosphatase [Streptomyces sp. V4-01]|uniref:PP2C family protein-serine/threonine phosphatase n=1 Tax=Actinacidiphila polyblastidii TaxID=3110430 RepID=A0ABU7PF79_9ACTN|nr:PP2C family protein-serine/threonine phosphatase [Streptomyces sp. V4-01]
MAIPFALIVAITAVDLSLPDDVHLGPLLVIAPALTASIAGPRMTALAGAGAVVAQLLIGVYHGGLGTPNHMAQVIALAVLSTLVVLVSLIKERRHRELSRARSVAEAAQRVLLRPPPRRIGALRVSWLYLASEDEAKIGGDLFAVARAAKPATRVIIGDVRGKGLGAIGEASVVLGAFREGAHRYDGLPELVSVMEDSLSRNLEEVGGADRGEHFVTALVLDLPDGDGPAEMIDCGHPPPLLLHEQGTAVLPSRHYEPPLGLGELALAGRRAGPFAFVPGDMLVLCTDGVIEARSPAGTFYPLAERVAGFPATSPEVLLRHIHRDLLDHIGGEPADDAAVLVIERLSADGSPAGRRTGAKRRAHPSDP